MPRLFWQEQSPHARVVNNMTRVGLGVLSVFGVAIRLQNEATANDRFQERTKSLPRGVSGPSCMSISSLDRTPGVAGS